MKPSRAALLAVTGAVALGVLVYSRFGDPASSVPPKTPVEVQMPVEAVVEPFTAEPADSSSSEGALQERGAAPAREPVPAIGPRGMVIEAGTGRPLPGLAVRMKFGGTVLAETVTGEDGSFRLPLPERSHRSVEVAGDGWRISPVRYRLDEDQSEGKFELLFEARRIVAAPVRGRLLDRDTREPLPEFLIEVRGPSDAPKRIPMDDEEGQDPPVTIRFHAPPRRIETVITDQDGRFVTAGGFEAGSLALDLIDHPSLRERQRVSPDEAMRLQHEHAFVQGQDPPEAIFETVVGPTYRVALTLPVGTDEEDLFATFPGDLSGGDPGLHRVIAEDPASPMALFYGSALHPEALEPRAALRPGEPRWVRFRSPVQLLPVLSDDHDLHVRSLDGHWSGSAQVTSLEGVYPEILSIELASVGAIEGLVRGPGGKPVPSAWILLDSRAAPETVRGVGADAGGRFSFRWLPSGEYEVRVKSDRHDEWAAAVSVEPGTTKELDVSLSGAAGLGTISGVLRSRTGQHRSRGGIMLLKSQEDPGFFLIQTASYRKRDGEYVAAFSFDEIPPGKYELSLNPLDNLRWSTLRMTVSPPAEGLEFICEDDVPTFELGFRAIDARSGEVIQETWTIVWQGDPSEDIRLEDDWETGLYKGVPEGVPIRWMLRAQGYRLEWGDESGSGSEGDERIVEARLVPGWGQLFHVTTREREPFPGVELVVDGQPVGRTDARGMVWMNLDTRPAKLEFRLEGWHVSWGRIDPAEPDFGWGPETPVYLSPDE